MSAPDRFSFPFSSPSSSGPFSDRLRLGQGSTEYLVILAITLFLALVVLEVVGFFPSFSYDAQVGDSIQYWGNAASPIAIIDFKQTGSSFSAVVENRASANLHLTGFGLTPASPTAPVTFQPASALPVLPPGGRAMLSLTTVSCAGRQTISYGVQINYSTDQVAGLTQTGVKPLYVTCAT